MADRPSFYAYIDRGLSNIIPNYNQSPLNVTGVQPTQLIKSALTNTLGLLGGLWQNYLDYQTNRLSDDIAEAVTQRWSTDRLAYELGVKAFEAPGVLPISNGTYYFDGYRIEVEECLLAPAGAQPLIVPFVPKPGRIWVYLSTAGIIDPTQPFAAIRTEGVNPGDPPTPGPQELALVGVDVDAAGLTAANTYPAGEPDEEVVFGLRPQRWTGTVTHEGAFSATTLAVEELTAGDGLGVPITVANVPALVVGLVVTGAGDTFAATCDGAGHTSIAAFNTSAETTLVVAQAGTGRAGLLQNNDATSCTLKLEQADAGCALEMENNGIGSTLAVLNNGGGPAGTFETTSAGAAMTVANNGAGLALDIPSGNVNLAAMVGLVGTATSPITGGNFTCLDTLVVTNGAEGPGSTALVLNEGATVPDTKTVTLGANVVVNAGADLALNVGDDLVEVIGTGASVTYDTGAVLTMGSGSTVDMVDNTGSVITGDLTLLEKSSPFSAGVFAWDGRAVTVGDSGAAPRLSQPRASYIAGPISTPAAITDTGASVSLQMRTGESAWVVMSAGVRNDTIGDTIETRIEANAVLLGDSDRSYEPTGMGLGSVRVVRANQYTHVGVDSLVTFVARYGAGAGTTTAQSISITAAHV